MLRFLTCFGSLNFQVNVRVTTMDAELEFAIQPNTTGKQLFDQVSMGDASIRIRGWGSFGSVMFSPDVFHPKTTCKLLFDLMGKAVRSRVLVRGHLGSVV